MSKRALIYGLTVALALIGPARAADKPPAYMDPSTGYRISMSRRSSRTRSMRSPPCGGKVTGARDAGPPGPNGH